MFEKEKEKGEHEKAGKALNQFWGSAFGKLFKS